jgi:hypothetical protein
MNFEDIPERPQRQDSLNDQLEDLVAVANRLGMYDAADYLQRRELEKVSES